MKIIIIFLLFFSIVIKTNAKEVDSKLLLAIDVSGSIDDDEYNKMMNGYANAFLNEQVKNVILNGPNGKILVSILLWSDDTMLSLDWTLIENENDLLKLSNHLRNIERPFKGPTYLSNSLIKAREIFTSVEHIESIKKIIDVSSDGTNDSNTSMAIAQEYFDESFIINAIIFNEGIGSNIDNLYEYYKNYVISENGFIIKSEDLDDFERFLIKKLILELM